MSTISKILIAAAFSATVAGAFTGVAISSETEEAIASVNCGDAYWPMIPAECLQDAQDRSVRIVAIDDAVAEPAMQDRFDIAFQ